MRKKPYTVLSHLLHLGGAIDFLEEIEEVVSQLALFTGFTSEEIGVLCAHMECYSAPTNHSVLTEATEGDFLIIILTGGVDVVKAKGNSGQKVVAQVGPGGFLGEMSLVDGQKRFASCVTTRPTDIAVLTRDDLTSIMLDHPALGNKVLLLILQLVTGRLRDATTRMMPTIVADWV